MVLTKYLPDAGDYVDGAVMLGQAKNYSIENPYKKIHVEYIFTYEKSLDRFIPQEDYSKKYKRFDG